MTDLPINLRCQEILAILHANKTMVWRIMNPQPPDECSISYMLGNESWLPGKGRAPVRLWVREPWCNFGADGRGPLGFRADFFRKGAAGGMPSLPPGVPWHNAYTMPRQISRLTLLVEEVQIERIQDFARGSNAGKGVVFSWADDDETWMANPWVAVITFKAVLGNIDSLEDHPCS